MSQNPSILKQLQEWKAAINRCRHMSLGKTKDWDGVFSLAMEIVKVIPYSHALLSLLPNTENVGICASCLRERLYSLKARKTVTEMIIRHCLQF